MLAGVGSFFYNSTLLLHILAVVVAFAPAFVWPVIRVTMRRAGGASLPEAVARQIIELRAAINRGDSGGPFVLADGTVGGIVFAEARSDEDVGYALSPRSVAVRIQPSIGRTGEVSVGDCIR